MSLLFTRGVYREIFYCSKKFLFSNNTLTRKVFFILMLSCKGDLRFIKTFEMMPEQLCLRFLYRYKIKAIHLVLFEIFCSLIGCACAWPRPPNIIVSTCGKLWFLSTYNWISFIPHFAHKIKKTKTNGLFLRKPVNREMDCQTDRTAVIPPTCFTRVQKVETL